MTSRVHSTASSSHYFPQPVGLKPENELLFHKTRLVPKQPLYRPAALRRNDSTSSELFLRPPPPPLSPSLSSDSKSSWLAALPWSPTVTDWDNSSTKSSDPVRGSMLPRALWQPDQDAISCSEEDCHTKFSVINRKHHCRRCGQIFCSSHSSRTSLLWPSTDEVHAPPTPKASPRSTPRSSSLDLPSLLSHSPSSTTFSSLSSQSYDSTSTATQTTSPSQSQPPSVPHSRSSSMNSYNCRPIAARVCDTCFFSSPVPSLPPTITSLGSHPRPMSASRSSSRSTSQSPSQSPPPPQNFHQSSSEFLSYHAGGSTSGRRAQSASRSRQSSTTSTSNSSSNLTTSPPSTISSATSEGYVNRARELSPAASLAARNKRAMNHRGIILPPGVVGVGHEEVETTEEEDNGEEEEVWDGTKKSNAATGPGVDFSWATF